MLYQSVDPFEMVKKVRIMNLYEQISEFKVVKRNFEEQHRRMSSLERTLDKTG